MDVARYVVGKHFRICDLPIKKTFNRGHQEKALNLLRDGASYEDVAGEFGVEPDTVYRLAKRRNVVNGGKRKRGPVISFRLTEEELKALDALMVKHDFKSRSDIARGLVRGAVGFLEVSQNTLSEFEGISTELNRIGTNVNQLTVAANSRRVDLVRHQWDDLKELEAVLPKLRRFMTLAVKEMRRQSTVLWRKSEHGS